VNLLHLGLGWIGDRGGGLERYQHGLCEAQANLGRSVRAFVQSRMPISLPTTYDVEAYASPDESRRVKISKSKKAILPYLRHRDVIFVSHHASISSSLVRELGGIPHVVHFHGPWADESHVEGAPKWKTWLQRRFERKAYHSADRIITLSDSFKRIVIERYGIDDSSVHVIPGGINSAAADPGVDRTGARERLGWPKDRPILLSVRRLVRRVGVDVLVDAVARLRGRHSDLLTLIGGTGPLKFELEQKIKDNGLEQHVRLLGFIPEEQLPFAYAAADYSIVPTQGLEGFGLVTIESMAAGTPAIVTPVGSLPEIINPFCEKLILSGSGPCEISAGLDQIIGGNLMIPGVESCKRYVCDHFDWRIIAPRLNSIYIEAFRGKNLPNA
jgi:glycosyltransferase involved in cell wall biosynthesis